MQIQFSEIETESELSNVCRAAIEDKVTPGLVGGFWSNKAANKVHWIGTGFKDYSNSEAVSLNTVYDLSSVSKVYATASLTAYLIDRGWLNWNTSVSSVLPKYPFRDICVRHLLTHTAGFKAWQPYWEWLRQNLNSPSLHEIQVAQRQSEIQKLVLSEKPEVGVGKRALYSDISFMILGFLLEELLGQPLDKAVSTNLWRPMNLSNSSYRRVTTSSMAAYHLPENREVAPTENCPWRGGVLKGQVHDDNCWAMGGYGGHAGVFSTLPDVFSFVVKLFGGFFTTQTLTSLWTRANGFERTLGWDTPTGSMTGSRFSPGSVGHWGFTGTSLWIDVIQRFAVVLLTNRVHPNRDNQKIKQFRPTFHDTIIKTCRNLR